MTRERRNEIEEKLFDRQPDMTWNERALFELVSDLLDRVAMLEARERLR